MVRKVIVNNIVSLDGRYADEGDNPLALNMDAAFDRANLETAESADVILLGRTSFDGFSAHWPFVADAPEPEDPDAPEARAFDPVNRAMSRRYNALPKVVVSDSGPIDPDNAWHDSTTVIKRADALLAENLIDELHLMISPTALGSGVAAFAAAHDSCTPWSTDSRSRMRCLPTPRSRTSRLTCRERPPITY